MNPIVTSTVKLSDFIDKQHRYNMLASKRADALNFRYYQTGIPLEFFQPSPSPKASAYVPMDPMPVSSIRQSLDDIMAKFKTDEVRSALNLPSSKLRNSVRLPQIKTRGAKIRESTEVLIDNEY